MLPEALHLTVCGASESRGFLHEGRKQNSAIQKEGYGIMSRKSLVTLLLIIAFALLGVGLFIAGAIWRGRVTARAAVTDSRKLTAPAKLATLVRGQTGEATDCVKRVGLP